MPTDISLVEVVRWMVVGMPYAFLVFLVVFLLLGAVLDFHWRKYGIGLIQAFKFRITYVAIGIILLGVMAVSLITS
jgi:hypothetical protein